MVIKRKLFAKRRPKERTQVSQEMRDRVNSMSDDELHHIINDESCNDAELIEAVRRKLSGRFPNPGTDGEHVFGLHNKN